MADDEDGLLRAKERCNLLVKIKSTVDILLASNGSNVWSTYGGLARITDDLEHIFRHGLREIQGIFSDQNDYTIFLRGLKVLRPSSTVSGSSSLQKNAVENSMLNRGQAWLQQALLNHCLSSYVTMLVNNRQHLYECYYDFAFLRSKQHVEALCTCLKAVEKGNPGLLTQVDHALLDASRYVQLWLHREDEKASIKSTTPPEDLEFCGEESLINEQISNMNERSHSPDISIVYSDSGSSRDDIQSVLSTESPRDNQIEVCGSSEENNTNGSDQMPPYPENCCYNLQEAVEQVECLDDHVQANPSSMEGSDDFTEGRVNGEHFSFAAGPKGESRSFDGLEDVGGVAIVKTKKKSRVINRATLAQAALSAVLEIEEPNSVPGSPCSFHKLRRTSSLDDDLLRSSETNSSEALKGERGSKSTVMSKPAAPNRKSDLSETDGFIRQPVASAITDHQRKKLIGHSRSKSEQIGMAKSKKQVVLTEPSEAKERRSGSFSGLQSRLASSLPAQSEYLYYNDPLITDPYGDQSYTSLLATQDFTSCELDKENAHFSISEALIAAIEQMKCDEVIASEDEDDDDDAEIQQLKQEIERRRIEKKQEKLRWQPAFSDGKSTSKSSSLSVVSTSSSLSDSDRDLSPGWEEITTVDEQFPIETDVSSATVARVAKATTAADHAFPDGSEFGQSPPLSAEAVAKSLLLKFANKKHPAASELHWLVSYQDAPQSLLPLPETVAVAPDDALYDGGEVASPPQRRVSLPCRIRGNMEWAPPRQQIIFHIHGAPRRKNVMAQQNYRCGGCGMRVDPEFMKRFRYCNYLGKYFCSSCHNNALETIPARVVRKWDFKKYEVSEFARKLLLDIHSEPLFNIRDLNSSLYSRVRPLEETKDLRRQLHYFRNFARACRKARDLLKELETIPEHIFSDCHLYSMRDLLQVKSGEMPQYFKEIAKESLEHIFQCQLCLAKGFICEYCKLDDIIYPFELKKAVQCRGCHASFHKECFVEGKCPKCERIRIRRNMLAEPSSPQESARSDGLDLR